MATQNLPSERARSVAGGVMVGLGLHILFGNLDRAAAQLSHSLGTTGDGTLGVLPSIVLTASQAVQAYGLNHQAFLLGLFRIMLSLWPLLLVISGTMILRDAFREGVKALPTPIKYFQNKNSGCRFRCPSFDI